MGNWIAMKTIYFFKVYWIAMKTTVEELVFWVKIRSFIWDMLNLSNLRDLLVQKASSRFEVQVCTSSQDKCQS